MNETRNELQQENKNSSRGAFWGTIALAGIALLVYAYFAIFLFRQPKTPVILVGLTVFLFSLGSAVTSIVLTIRGRQQSAVKLALYTLFIMGITIVSVFQGRARTASLSILVISIIAILYLLPSQFRRWYSAVTAAAMIVMWSLEWVNPPWRVEIAAAKIGPAAVIVFVLIVGWIAFTQSRRFIAASLRNKLVVAFVAMAFFAVSAIGIVTNITATAQLDVVLGENFSELASRMAKDTADTVVNSKTALDGLVLNKFVQDTVEAANLSGDSNISALTALDQQWRSANDKDPVIVGVLNNDLAGELHELQARLPQYAELFVTDRYGAVIGSTDRTSDYYQADEAWWQSAWNNGQGATYISEPVFDESTATYAINMALPIPAHNRSDILGVLRATVNINELRDALSANQFSQTGQAILLFSNNQYLSRETGTDLGTLNTETAAAIESILAGGYGEISYDGADSLASKAPVVSSKNDAQEVIDQLDWTIVVHQDISEAHAPIAATTRGVVYTAIAVLLAAALLALFIGGQFVKPVESLTAIAERLAKGDLSAQAAETSQDEIGTLAKTFNRMRTQLTDLIGSLEQRVADRTRNLELAAEVGRAVSQVRNLEVMLKDACELILKEFNLYYVQVYLTDPSQTTLNLEAGTGNVGAQLVGRGHSLPINLGSINGRAAAEKQAVVISDTTQSTTFRQNPLLPETRGEMAVPLVVANKVVGVLDMQSTNPGVLTMEILPAFQALAGQLAVAIQNSNLLAETEQARAEVERQARRLVRESWIEHLDAIHKPEQLGFVYDSHKVSPLTELDESQAPYDGKAVSVPIALAGEPLGSLVVEISDESRREQTGELVKVIAHQVAQQIENLRLLESAQRYRYEAEQAARLQTLEGWQKYMASRSTENLGYLYDAKEVRPQDHTQMEADFRFTLPLKARDEMIGKVWVQGLTETDQESVELVNAVAERLSTHVESLRLFEETRFGQLELDKRARQLSAVAEISTASSRQLDIQPMLESVVQLTQRKFGLYHAHVFLYNEQTNMLKIAACGWKEGDEQEGMHGTTAIPFDQEQSLVARAARTQKAVIVNDVHNEPGWLPNPLLPDTASELAVPLLIGDRVLGVLDVQADRRNAFSEEDANIQTTLASQVATALQNARSFTQAQKQAEREAMLNVINQKIQSATSVEAVLQIAARELGHALGAPMTIAQLSMKDKSS